MRRQSPDGVELLLGSLDRLITMQLLDNDEAGFLEIGYWNARHLMPRYFQIYMDDKDPDGFLKQMSRMRDHLIGLGELIVAEVGKNSYVAHINYGQQTGHKCYLHQSMHR